uniref:Small ribosomal subunit protein uS4c n=1 Tax=Tydemania expeditionis TaxID=325645 RepID=A0A0D6E2Z1_TYDEX|nr:ribosomal protein S4 [Tydemania expeditionis]CEO91142.1 ribosomal protein S4 [Tydemania expeditionis]
MSRYYGGKTRILKRLGPLPGFGLNINGKCQKLPKNKNIRKKKKNKISFRTRLQEKQKLRYHYGLTERNLLRYIEKARRKKISTSQTLLNNLEMRLDNIVFRLGLASTLPGARQMVTHGHILVNGKRQNIPSYQCHKEDSITLKKKNNRLGQRTYSLPSFLSFDEKTGTGKIVGKVSRNDIGLKINELLVIEYYSR